MVSPTMVMRTVVSPTMVIRIDQHKSQHTMVFISMESDTGKQGYNVSYTNI